MKVNMNTMATVTLNAVGEEMFNRYLRRYSAELQLPISEIKACYNYSAKKVLVCPLFQLFQIFPTKDVVFVNNAIDLKLASTNLPEPNSGLHLVKFKNLDIPVVAILNLLAPDSKPVWVFDNYFYGIEEMEWCLKYE
jgi:hypothetical protein